MPENADLETSLQNRPETEDADNVENKSDTQENTEIEPEREQTPEEIEEEMDNIIQQLNSAIDVPD